MTEEESHQPPVPISAPAPPPQPQPQPSTSNVEHLFTNESPHLVTFLKIVIVALFLYPLVHYAFIERNNAQISAGDDASELAVEDQIVMPPVVKVRIKKPQPTCPIAYLRVILLDICQDLYIKHEQCTPEDVHDPEKHKLPRPPRIAKNATTGEPRGTIVGCIAAGLLMTSLGAAFVELYKAKSGGGKTSAKTKPPMSRKCSLADLTVLKHNRKELVRKESILELPEAAGSTQQLVFFSPPPLYRRSSFPVGPSPSEVLYDVFEYRRTSLMEPMMRRLSIIDSSRRSSVEKRKTSIDVSRRISMDDSPERRHHTRLVHRH